MNYQIEYGKGNTQTVTLPQNGSYTTDLMS